MRRLAILPVLLVLLAACGSREVPMPPDALQELFPDSVRNLGVIGRGGSVDGAEGFEISRATVRLGLVQGQEGGPAVALSIVDLRGPEMAESMGFGWGVSPEPAGTVTGQGTTERVVAESFNGHPARRARDNTLRRDELMLLVNKRFLVEARGEGVDADVVNEALRAVRLSRLPG